MKTTSTLDEAGLQLITSNTVNYSLYADIKDTVFGSPNATFNGYAYDGLKRNSGVVDEFDVASWALESSSSNRGDEDTFPERVFIIANGTSIVILNADSLKVWIRINLSEQILKVGFDSGYLSAISLNTLYLFSFVEDKFYIITSSSFDEYLQVSTRHSPVSNGTSSERIYGENRDIDIKKILDDILVCVAHKRGISSFKLNLISSGTINHNLFEDSITLNNTNSVEISNSEIVQAPPYTTDPLDYSSKGLRGDLIKFTLPTTTGYDITILSTLEDRFLITGTVDPSLIGSHTSVSITVLKQGNICKILSDGSLFFSAGESFYHSNTAWLTGSVNVFTDDKSICPVSLSLSAPFNDSTLSGDELFVASSSGVVVIDKNSVDNNLPYELRYSSSPDATYFDIFLSSVIPTTSVAIDPQNGNILMSALDKIYEVQPSGDLQKLVRTVDAGATVNHILAFYNPNNNLGV